MKLRRRRRRRAVSSCVLPGALKSIYQVIKNGSNLQQMGDMMHHWWGKYYLHYLQRTSPQEHSGYVSPPHDECHWFMPGFYVAAEIHWLFKVSWQEWRWSNVNYCSVFCDTFTGRISLSGFKNVSPGDSEANAVSWQTRWKPPNAYLRGLISVTTQTSVVKV